MVVDSEENDPQINSNYHYYDWSENTYQTHCRKVYDGTWNSEENDPQQEIIICIATFPMHTIQPVRNQKELVDKLGKSLDNAKIQCEDLGFKKIERRNLGNAF